MYRMGEKTLVAFRQLSSPVVRNGDAVSTLFCSVGTVQKKEKNIPNWEKIVG